MPLKETAEEESNPVPTIVSVWDTDPTGKEAGTKGGAITGTGLLTKIWSEAVSAVRVVFGKMAGNIETTVNGPPADCGAEY